MAMQVQITVDVSKLKSAIKDINYDIATLKVNGSNVTIGGKKLNAEVKETKRNVQQLNKELKKTGAEGAAAAAKTAAGLKGMSAQSKAAIGFIGNMIKGFITPWTLLIIGVDLAWRGIKKIYNDLTDSVAELIHKSQLYVKWTDKQISKFNEEKKTVDELVKALDDLHKKGVLNNDEQMRAQNIIDKLNKQYKGLKLSIDDVIGSTEKWLNAQKRIGQTQDQIELGLLNEKRESQKKNVEAILKDVFGKNYTLDKAVTGSDFFNWSQRNMPTWLGGASDEEMMATGAKFNKGDLTGKRDTLKEVIRKYGNNEVLQQAIDALDELIATDEQITNIVDPRSIKDRADKRAEKTIGQIEKTTNTLEEQNKRARQQLEQQDIDDAFNAKPIEQRMAILKNQADTTRQEIDEINRQIETAASLVGVKTEDLNKMVADAQKTQAKIDSLDSQIAAAAQKEQSLQEEIGKRMYEIEDQFPMASEEVLRSKGGNPRPMAAIVFEANVEPLEKQLEALRKQKEALEAERSGLATDYEGISSDLSDANIKMKQSGLDYQEALAKSIQLQQTLYDVTKKWGELNSQQLAKAAADLEKYQKAQDLIKNGVFSVESQVLKKQGHERESLVLEQRRNIEKILERPLDSQKDKGLLDSIENYADVQMALNGLNEAKMNLQSDKVQANSLARMGGFSSSIVVDRMDVNKEALKVAKKSSDYLNTINTGIQQIHKDLNF